MKKYGLVIWLEHHKIENFILIHIPNLLLGLNIYVIKYNKLIWGFFFFENLNYLIVRDFWMVQIWLYFHKSIWVIYIYIYIQFLCPKSIFFESFTWGIIHMDFVGFPFKTSKLKNDGNYIKYKFSHRFGKVCRWLDMNYSNTKIIFFLKVTTMSIQIILKNLVWTYKKCNFYQYWATIPCIHSSKTCFSQ